MRTQNLATLLATSAAILTLGACQSVGPTTFSQSAAAPATTPVVTGSTGVTTGNPLTNPAPTGTPSTAQATAPTSITPATIATSTTPSPTLGALTGPATFNTASAHQLYNQTGGGVFYTGVQPVTVSDNMKITRDPRDATYIVSITGLDPVSANTRFQDPAHRTTYTGAAADLAAQAESPDLVLGTLLPNIPNTEYYSAGSVSGTSPRTVSKSVFFTERVGTAESSTQYVSWGAFWKYDASGEIALRAQSFQRSSAIFGYNTLAANVPKTGTANYSGGLYADVIDARTFYTIGGTSNFAIDFAGSKGTFSLNGRFVSAGPDPALAPRLGSTFVAAGEIILARPATGANTSATAAPIGVFSGKVTSLALGGSTIDYLPNETRANSFQGTSVEGGFFGPRAEEIGATFRIVGGVPDQRIDITGAVTGRKN